MTHPAIALGELMLSVPIVPDDPSTAVRSAMPGVAAVVVVVAGALEVVLGGAELVVAVGVAEVVVVAESYILQFRVVGDGAQPRRRRSQRHAHDISVRRRLLLPEAPISQTHSNPQGNKIAGESGVWCRHRESNPDARRRCILSAVRLPIPPCRPDWSS